MELHLAGPDFADVEQLIDKTNQTMVFSLNDVEYFGHYRVGYFALLQSLNCQMHGCDRTADLMSCDRKKLVARAHRFLDLSIQTRIFHGKRRSAREPFGE